MVDFAKTGLSYVFGDKMDAGGNSNMFKLFAPPSEGRRAFYFSDRDILGMFSEEVLTHYSPFRFSLSEYQS